MRKVCLLSLLGWLGGLWPFAASGQIDPELRRLFQLGYNQPVEGKSPITGYGFYYHNRPNFPATNQTLRLAVAPVYIDAELGFSQLLGRNTDLAVGLNGGGFAHSYAEIRRGHFYQEESFTGHGGEINSSLYHRMNPNFEVPLWAVLRAGARRLFYERDSKTADAFRVPDDWTSLNFRTGLRFGGQEPSMTTPLAMELSIWHESQVRLESGPYGFEGDREIKVDSHLFWARALLKLMFSNEQLAEVSVTAGTSVDADRFSAYRLGGVLPFASEFPLSIPGYYWQELSAQSFVLFNGQYGFPLTPQKNWRFTTYGAVSALDHLDGFEQKHDWHAGLGGGLTYISPSGTWLVSLIYGHGFNALRGGEKGANQVGLLMQWDLDAKGRGKSRFFMPGVSPYRSRGGEQLFRN